MFKSAILQSILTVFVLFFIPFQETDAQLEDKDTQELKKSALADFKAGNYSSSLNSYNELIKRYPKDGVFNYYSGRCLFNLNKTIPTAIKYLQYAASRPNVPSDVFYFLGEAYMQNYQFPEAKKAYSQFNDVATKTQLKELALLRKAEIAGNAIANTRQYNTIEIITSSLFNFQDQSYVKQIGAVGGVLGFKSIQLKSPLEETDALSGLCFIPRDPVKGDYLYYCGYGKSKKRGTDIYRIKIVGEKRLAEPELLESVSSNYNDILPYFDPVGKDLYFASEGYSSMGGYDVFKSHFNQEKNTWSEPQNLGFPVNSPSNEYVFLPGTDLGSVLLITDRQGLDSMMTVYLLRIREPKKAALTADNEELKRIGRFGGIESIPDIIDIAEQGIPVIDTLKTGSGLIPVEPRPIVRKDIQASSEYNNNLKLALNYQFKSDSLARLAREARINVKSMPEPDQRWAIQSNIILWEKQSVEQQAKADECYRLARKLESGKSAGNKIPSAIKKDTMLNDLTVYKFKPARELPLNTAIKTDTEVAVVNTGVKGMERPVGTGNPMPKKGVGNNQFEVLGKSPNSSGNPIPADIAFPSGAFYRIQLGVFSKKVEWNAFGGLSPITAEIVPGKPLTRYYAGRFTKFESAKAALNIVKSNGFKDGFVVAWYNGKKLAIEKVMEFEKRDGN